MYKRQQFDAFKVKDKEESRVAIFDYQPFVLRKLNPHFMKNIFVCYASKDREHKALMLDYLVNPIREGKINVWHDGELDTGDEWDEEIKKKLDTADIVIVLVSQQALNSHYINGVEMKRALKRYEEGQLRLLPVLIRHSDIGDWKILPEEVKEGVKQKKVSMGKFQFFPKVPTDKGYELIPFNDMKESEQEKYWLAFKEELMKFV